MDLIQQFPEMLPALNEQNSRIQHRSRAPLGKLFRCFPCLPGGLLYLSQCGCVVGFLACLEGGDLRMQFIQEQEAATELLEIAVV